MGTMIKNKITSRPSRGWWWWWLTSMRQSWRLETRLLKDDQMDNNVKELVITRQTWLSRKRSPIDHQEDDNGGEFLVIKWSWQLGTRSLIRSPTYY